MNIPALTLALAGLLLVMVAWTAYLATIPKGTVPVRPIGTILLQLAGTGLAMVGIVMQLRQGGSLAAAVIPPAAFAVAMGLFFVVLYTQRKTPVGKITVKVGDTLLPFAVQDSDGNAFSSASLAGRRILLKFFRGGW